MTRTLLLEPFGGMAGDMLLAALCDLGEDAFGLAELERFARSLVPEEVRIELAETHRRGLRAKTLRVVTPESGAPPHRHLSDLLALLERCALSRAGEERAARVLRRLGEAEAHIHGIPLERVHFHEIGAVDTILDVAGAVRAMELLEVERGLAAPPYVGGGTVVCAHGELPVPAPATARLLEGRRLRHGPGGERCTPTAAALLVELFEEWDGQLTEGTFVASGYGAGSRDPDEGPPNVLRAGLLETDGVGAPRTEAWLVECNLDDASGEEVGFLLGELRAAGALEAWSSAVQMKKDRPGALVSALCRSERRAELEAVLFRNSPTLGVRWSRVERTECEREERCVRLRIGDADEEVRVKLRRAPGHGRGHAVGATALDVSPEFDDLARIARASGLPLRELEARVLALVREGQREA